MKITKFPGSVRIQADNPLEDNVLENACKSFHRSTGIMPDGSKAIDLTYEELLRFSLAIGLGTI